MPSTLAALNSRFSIGDTIAGESRDMGLGKLSAFDEITLPFCDVITVHFPTSIRK